MPPDVSSDSADSCVTWHRSLSRTGESLGKPVHFGDPSRPLFGMLHEPSLLARGVGVVLCNPFGYEAICAHRTYRHLAERLAQRGFTVLRFDYDGTGDSYGSDRDPQRIRAWIASIHDAVTELHERAGVAEVILFGMRLGGLLALEASRTSRVAGVTLWAPCANGKAYLRELKALRAIHEDGAAPNPPSADGDEESAGFLLTRQTQADLAALDVRLMAFPEPLPVLLLAREELPSDGRIAQDLRARGLDVQTERVTGYAGVMVDPHKSSDPVAVFEAVERWLEQPRPASRRGNSVASTSAREPAVRAVDERPARFGSLGVFGILSSAGSGSEHRTDAQPERALVFLNPGAIHHIGMNRMYVELARRWAAHGLPALRFDISGIGESPAAPGTPEHRMYSQHSVADAVAALDYLHATREAERYTLLGLCSGAYAAFHTALRDPRVDQVILINPQTFDYREGDSLEVQKRKNFREARYYRRSLFRRASWAKALRGEVDFGYVLGVLTERARSFGRSRLEHWQGYLHEQIPGLPKSSNPLYEAFARLLERGCAVSLIYCADDPGLEHFNEQVGSRRGKLLAHPRFHLNVIDGPDHTFTPLWSQAKLVELLDQALFGTHDLNPRPRLNWRQTARNRPSFVDGALTQPFLR